MPYVSDKQRRWAHTEEGIRALGKNKVKEYNDKSRGKDLPEESKKEAGMKKIAAEIRNYLDEKAAKTAQLKTLSNVLLGKPWHGTESVGALGLGKSNVLQNNEMLIRLLGGLAGGGLGAAVAADHTRGNDEGISRALKILGAGAGGAMLGSRAGGALQGAGAELARQIGAQSEGSMLDSALLRGMYVPSDPVMARQVRGQHLLGNLLNPLTIPFSPITSQVTAPLAHLGLGIGNAVGGLIPR